MGKSKSKKYNELCEYFKECVKYYQKEFSLYNYEISIFSQIKPSARASCYYNISGRVASICWSEDWLEGNPTKKEIEKTAFHEVLELLLGELSDYSHNLNKSRADDDVDRAIHDIIRTMENVVLPLMSKDKS